MQFSPRASLLLSYVYCLFLKLKGALQGNDTVVDRFAFYAVFAVYAVETVSYELEAVVCFCIHQHRLNETFYDLFGVRV